MSSGIVLEDSIKWISFHSGYDFAYLLKVLTCEPLPADESEFFDLVHTYFPCIYDIKYLMKSCKNLKGGLNDLAEILEVERIGPQHQAGSDSLLTSATFFKMKQLFFENTIDNSKYLGVLYGLGAPYQFSNDSNPDVVNKNEDGYTLNDESPPASNNRPTTAALTASSSQLIGSSVSNGMNSEPTGANKGRKNSRRSPQSTNGYSSHTNGSSTASNYSSGSYANAIQNGNTSSSSSPSSTSSPSTSYSNAVTYSFNSNGHVNGHMNGFQKSTYRPRNQPAWANSSYETQIA